MSNVYSVFARQNEAANQTVIALLNKMTNDEREKERGSYYHSLSGLMRHVDSGILFFLKNIVGALAGKPAAAPLVSIADMKIPEGALTEAQWKEACATIAAIDKGYIDFCDALTDADLTAQAKWVAPTPPVVPVSFILEGLIAHGLHHRGQISQILDEMKIDNDYSGLSPAFLK